MVDHIARGLCTILEGCPILRGKHHICVLRIMTQRLPNHNAGLGPAVQSASGLHFNNNLRIAAHRLVYIIQLISISPNIRRAAAECILLIG
ncbi:hypothetical protein D3C71_1620220 [compost metagenome]